MVHKEWQKQMLLGDEGENLIKWENYVNDLYVILIGYLVGACEKFYKEIFMR